MKNIPRNLKKKIRFFVYLHEKHTKILDLNLKKQGRIVKSQKKRKHIYIQKDKEITIYFSHCTHDLVYLNKVLQFFTQMLPDIFYCLNESCICFFLFPFCPVYEICEYFCQYCF